jgi:hypothetical protein
MEGKKEGSKAKAAKPKPQPSQRKPLLLQNVGEKGKEGKKKKEIKGKEGDKGEIPSPSQPPKLKETKLLEKVSLE